MYDVGQDKKNVLVASTMPISTLCYGANVSTCISVQKKNKITKKILSSDSVF